MTAGRLNSTFGRGRCRTGSALILAVVLTSLLALVGVLFIMAARLDKMGTTAASEARALDFGVDTVVAQISEILAEDVPRVLDAQEYYDYPDVNDPWLADLEPYEGSDRSYNWRQISNLTGVGVLDHRDVPIRLVRDDEAIVDVNGLGSDADADGDGVSDARWYRIPGIMSARGQPIYAAVRIIDNGAMLNINTGYWFNDTELTQREWVDGSSPSQIDVVALAGGVSTAQESAASLLQARGITDTVDGLADYERSVVWGYLRPNASDPPYTYTPFDLSDELELRYRFLLNRTGVGTRAEAWGQFRGHTLSTPVSTDLDNWFPRASDALDPNYAYRHIATTYNMDRIITPRPIRFASQPRNPWKRVNVNRRPPDIVALREAITLALAETNPDPIAVDTAAAQITANIVDYTDDDDQVTAVPGVDPDDGTLVWYYGFDRPCIYISEVACHFVINPETEEIHRSYAVELYKPYFEDNDPKPLEWQLVIASPSGEREVVPIAWSGTRRFHVMLLEDPVAELFDDGDFSDPAADADTTPYDRTRYANPRAQNIEQAFDEGSTISLERWSVQSQTWVPDVDSVVVPAGWMDPNSGPQSFQRDISPRKCIRRLWSEEPAEPGLGTAPEFDLEPQEPNEIIQAHPANRPLTTIGELGMVFARSAYDDSVVKDATAAEVLLDLANPAYARLFRYLTVIDPNGYGWNPNETRVMGRININTAPWFVLGQLPWMQYGDAVPFERARAIVAHRDTYGPYKSTADLMRVEAMHSLAFDGQQNWFDDIPKGPDLDLVPDMALDDFEERDLIFQRISNLAAVRSDVFTAYILVRVGLDGPQRRMMAILDRSAVTPEGGQVRVVALHPVANPR